MLHHSQGRLEHQVDCMRQQTVDAPGLPFADLLCPHDVQRVIDQEGGGVRACIFSPAVTLYAFLAQVLSKDHSCRKAVARLLVSPAGARQHLGNARLVVILNRVDTAEREHLARETARLALDRTHRRAGCAPGGIRYDN